MKWGSLARIWTGLNPGGMLQLAGDGVVFHWPGPKLIRHRCWSVCVTIVRDYFCWWETPVLTAKLIKLPMWHMAHSMGDWMGQTWIECDYGAWRVQFKYPEPYTWNVNPEACWILQQARASSLGEWGQWFNYSVLYVVCRTQSSWVVVASLTMDLPPS